MEQETFGKLGVDIISLVKLAAHGDWHEVKFLGNLLASLLTAQGRWQQAEIVLREVCLVAFLTLHESNPDVLESISNLANVLKGHGNFEEAERMNKMALEICQRYFEKDQEYNRGYFEKDQEYTLASKNNLATVLQGQGKWQEAEEMYRDVLEVRCQVLGKSHAETLSTKHNLATVLQGQGKWQEAEKMHREVLEVMCQVHGEKHPDTLKPCQCPPQARQVSGSGGDA